jgi:hypothetical protein
MLELLTVSPLQCGLMTTCGIVAVGQEGMQNEDGGFGHGGHHTSRVVDRGEKK